MSVLWQNFDKQALAHAELLMYNCGYTPADLDGYFSDKNFGFIFAGYANWKRTAQCESGGVTLHEFSVVYEGKDYRIRYWIKPLNETRVLDLQNCQEAERRSKADVGRAKAVSRQRLARLEPDQVTASLRE